MGAGKIYRLLVALAGVVVLSLLSACSFLESGSSTKKYSSIENLQKDFIAAGGDCVSGKKRDVRHAEIGLDCLDGYTTLILFKDRAAAVRWGQAASALCNQMADCVGGALIGENWAITTQAPELFVEALGGTIQK